MGITATKIVEYAIQCDVCGCEEVIHTGCGDIHVHTINDAMKELRYHRSHGQILCDECFKNRKVTNVDND